MEHGETKLTSLKKKCLLQIAKDENFPVEWLTEIPRELLEKLKKYCSANQLLRLDHVFAENDVDTSWEWRLLLGQKFHKWTPWSRWVYGSESDQPFVVGLEHFRAKQMYCSLYAAGLMEEVSNYYRFGKPKVTGKWEGVGSLLPHVTTLSITPDTLSHIFKRWGPVNVVNLMIEFPSTRPLQLINVIDSILLTSLRSLSVECERTFSDNERASNRFVDLLAFLEAVYTQTKSRMANTIRESKDVTINRLAHAVELDKTELNHAEATGINIVDDTKTPVLLGDVDDNKNSKAECHYSAKCEGTTTAIAHSSNATSNEQDVIFNFCADDYLGYINDIEQANKDTEDDNEDSIDLYEEAFSSVKHEGCGITINDLVVYVKSLVGEIKEGSKNGNNVDDFGLESLSIRCAIFTQEELCRLCKLLQTWTSLRRISIEVSLEFQQTNCTTLSSMILQKVGYGQLTHLKLSGTSDSLINTTHSLLFLFFERFRVDVLPRIQPLQYLGLEDMEESRHPITDDGNLADSHPLTDIVNLADLYPYQIQAAKQIDLTGVSLSPALRKNFEHFLTCNMSLVHLSCSKCHYDLRQELLLPRLYHMDIHSKRFLDTIILDNMYPRQGGEITLIMLNVPLLKRFSLEDCEVYKDIDDEFLCALSSHKHLAELEISDDNLAYILMLSSICRQQNIKKILFCGLSGSSIMSAVQQACDQLPHRRSCLLEYLNLTSNVVTVAQRQSLRSMLKRRVKVLEVDCFFSQF